MEWEVHSWDIKKLTMDKLIKIDRTLYTKEEFQLNSGIQLSDLKFGKLRRMALATLGKFQKRTHEGQKVDTVKDFLMRTKSGSKRVRKILQGKVPDIVSGNMLKFGELTENIVNSHWSATLNSSWGFSYLHNSLKTFLFKLYNNILGINSRVAHFVRGHPSTCTFCDLSREPYEFSESTIHIFYECRHIEPLLTNFYSWIFSQENYAISRREFFLGFNFECNKKNKTLFLLNMLVKYHIWNCKLRFTIPEFEHLKEFVVHEILRIARQSTVMKNIFILGGVFENINDFHF